MFGSSSSFSRCAFHYNVVFSVEYQTPHILRPIKMHQLINRFISLSKWIMQCWRVLFQIQYWRQENWIQMCPSCVLVLPACHFFLFLSRSLAHSLGCFNSFWLYYLCCSFWTLIVSTLPCSLFHSCYRCHCYRYQKVRTFHGDGNPVELNRRKDLMLHCSNQIYSCQLFSGVNLATC